MKYTDDDMDEIFRRAAENYPLNTNSLDWGMIAGELHPQVVIIPETKRRLNSKPLWMLFLPVLVFMTYNLDTGHRHSSLDKGSWKGKDQVKNESISLVNKVAAVSNNNVVTPGPIEGKKDRPSLHTIRNQASVNIAAAELKAVLFSKEKQQTGSYNSSYSASKPNGIINNRGIATKAIPVDGADVGNKDTTIPDKPTDILISGLIKRSLSQGITGQLAVANERYIVPQSQLINTNKINDKNKRFYAGIIGGPSFSNVKLRWATNTDINAGILAGYIISKKWRIEGGVLFDKKYYSSEGKYMNTSKIILPPYAEISNITGDCRMVELPVTLQYIFKEHNNKLWYVSGGISSYLMKDENYEYTYYYSSSGQSYNHDRSYKNSTNNWLSVFQASVGYEYYFRKSTSFRIEPYVKIPVKGLGIGQLPVMSTGIQLGIIHKLF